MTTPKSATEILDDFGKHWRDSHRVEGTNGETVLYSMTKYFTEHKAWLRSALASHTAYLLGKWPQDSTQDIHNDYAEGKKDGYNIGTRDARTILEAEITELTK